jgi:uncharacterized protein
MKFQPDAISGNAISAYGPDWVAVNGEKFSHSLIVQVNDAPFNWQCPSFESLGPEHFEQLATLNAEVIIFGSGSRLRFPNPAWLEALYAKRVGVETMDTQAACRTYNFLAGEGRHVVAALLL